MKLNKKIKFLILVTALVVSGAFVYMQVSAGVLFGKTPVSLTDGLVGHWTFDGPDMINNVADSSGQGNTGYLNGQTATTTVIGKMGQALEFDGVDDYVDVGDIELSNDAITIAGWIKTASSGKLNTIISKYRASTVDRSYSLHIGTDDLFSFIISSNGGSGAGNSVSVKSTISQQAGAWTYVVGTFDGAGMVKIYINGQEDGTANDVGVVGISNTGREIRIGNIESGGEKYLDGILDDVRIYNRALSAGEIQKLYNQTKGSKVATTPQNTGEGLSNGLVGHWTFDGPNMLQNVADSSGSSNTGYLNGSFATATSTATKPGKLGQALEFNGVDDYVDVGVTNFPDVGGVKTVSVWLKKYTGAGGDVIWSLDSSGNAIYLIANGGMRKYGGGVVLNQNTAISVDNWTHYVYTFDGTTHRVYLNGSDNGSSVTVGDSGVTSGSNIGRRNFGTSYNFDGALDDVRIYNRALSAGEIQKLYNQTKGSKVATTPQNTGEGLSNGLVGHWTFDGPNMLQNVADSSGSSNTGYLNGSFATATSTATKPGKLGQALEFNGVDDYVEMGSGINLAGEFTISFMVKLTNIALWKRYTVMGQGNDQNSIGITAGGSGSVTDGLIKYRPGFSGYTAGGITINVDTWQHVVIKRDANNDLFTYVDGVDTSGSLNDSEVFDTSPLYIGRRGSSYMDGAIDDVRIYNRALSAGEVLKLYNMGR